MALVPRAAGRELEKWDTLVLDLNRRPLILKVYLALRYENVLLAHLGRLQLQDKEVVEAPLNCALSIARLVVYAAFGQVEP